MKCCTRTFHKIVFAHTKFGLVQMKENEVKRGVGADSAPWPERVFEIPAWIGLRHRCFKKMRIVMSKPLYNKEIRELIQKCKVLKHQHKGSKILTKKLRKIDKKFDKKIAHFNNKTLTDRIGTGPISKQDFWKVKKILAPKSISIPHCILDGMRNEITDPENIRNQFQTEFLYRL